MHFRAKMSLLAAGQKVRDIQIFEIHIPYIIFALVFCYVFTRFARKRQKAFI